MKNSDLGHYLSCDYRRPITNCDGLNFKDVTDAVVWCRAQGKHVSKDEILRACNANTIAELIGSKTITYGYGWEFIES